MHETTNLPFITAIESSLGTPSMTQPNPPYPPKPTDPKPPGPDWPPTNYNRTNIDPALAEEIEEALEPVYVSLGQEAIAGAEVYLQKQDEENGEGDTEEEPALPKREPGKNTPPPPPDAPPARKSGDKPTPYTPLKPGK